MSVRGKVPFGRVTHNQSMDRLMEAVHAFFRDMATCPDVIRHIAGLAA